jgi:hypothetical protein
MKRDGAKGQKMGDSLNPQIAIFGNFWDPCLKIVFQRINRGQAERTELFSFPPSFFFFSLS